MDKEYFGYVTLLQTQIERKRKREIMSLVFAINGQRFELELSSVDPSTTLLEFLRYQTSFKSVKLSCGEGDCFVFYPFFLLFMVLCLILLCLFWFRRMWCLCCSSLQVRSFFSFSCLFSSLMHDLILNLVFVLIFYDNSCCD